MDSSLVRASVLVIAIVWVVGCYINELFPGVKDEWAAAEGDDEVAGDAVVADVSQKDLNDDEEPP